MLVGKFNCSNDMRAGLSTKLDKLFPCFNAAITRGAHTATALPMYIPVHCCQRHLLRTQHDAFPWRSEIFPIIQVNACCTTIFAGGPLFILLETKL
jgi:hypothetical protein